MNRSKIIYYSVLLIFMVLLSFESTWAQLTCVEANGLNWCYNNQECGQACDDVCASGGMQVIEDNQVWFEAQNTEEKCIVISEAFGLGNTVDFFAWGFACLEDTALPVHGPGLNPPLFCSSSASCPQAHRASMDQLGIPCEGDPNNQVFARRSICPCEPIERNVPTLSHSGLIAMAVVLGIVGFMVMRRRKATV